MKHRELFRVNNLPVLQNKMYDTEAEAIDCPKGNIVLVQDIETGLIYNSAFNQDLLVYDSSYQNEQAYSVVFQQHLRDVMRTIDRHFKGKTLIEIGCGKGFFYNYLKNHGYSVIGVDPAYEGTNENIIKSHFTSKLGIQSDGIILRHVLEHISNPFGFLQTIAEVNGNRGLIYIEVPCFSWILQHRAWVDIHYEHVNYFRLFDFQQMFGNILESGYLFDNQFLYVVADTASLRKPKATKKDIVKFPKDFLNSVGKCASAFEQGKQHVIWGGASKGVIFALYMQRARVKIDIVVDINPAKQSKYLAGSGLCVYSPKEALGILKSGANVFVMNPIYFDEIIDLCGDRKFKFLR